MNTEKLIFATLLAAILAVTVAPSLATSLYAQDQGVKPDKPDKKNQICNPSVNVKAIGNVQNGTTYTANLDGLTQDKVADQNGKVNFHFDFKVKKQQQEIKPSKGLCFGKETTIPGDVQGNPFEVNITKKTSTVSVTIP